MKLIELFEESITVLRTNKLRTGLSALGIIIGIASVITLMTLGEASQRSVTERIQSLGANLLVVSPGAQEHGGFLRSSGGGSSTLTTDDLAAISTSQRLTTIDKVAGVYSSNAQISFESENDNVQISGVTADYFAVRNINLAEGMFFSVQDDFLSRKVAIVSNGVVEGLTIPSAVGATIRINGDTYRIVGVTEDTESFSFQSNVVYVPLSTAQNVLFGVDYLSQIYVGAKDASVMEAAENQLGWFLLELHGLETPEDADFSISSQGDILETVSEVTKTFTALLTGIAAISLVVGGIGIMNIMLVTVTERTREIGIRKALGAKRKFIIIQFLIESVILTFVGGIFGVLLGIVISFGLTTKLALPNIISIYSIILSVLVACLIGIVFGIYPAYKASKLHPIDALRYE